MHINDIIYFSHLLFNFTKKTNTRILGCDMNAKIREKRDLITASKDKISKLTSEEEKIAKLKEKTKKDIDEIQSEIQKYREELKSKLKAEENNV